MSKYMLPPNPGRANSGRGCTLTGEPAPDGHDHVQVCQCDSHTGVCEICRFKITVSPTDVEYGHARATNRAPDEDGVRRDCPHRPLECNTGEPHAWSGYDHEKWFSNESSSKYGGGSA